MLYLQHYWAYNKMFLLSTYMYLKKLLLKLWHFKTIHYKALLCFLYKALHKTNEIRHEIFKLCLCSEESQFKKRLNVELKNVMMRMDLEEATCKAVSGFKPFFSPFFFRQQQYWIIEQKNQSRYRYINKTVYLFPIDWDKSPQLKYFNKQSCILTCFR